MPTRQNFALNHIASPHRDIASLGALARELGIAGIEIRNDLAGVPLQDGTPAAAVREAAQAAGVTILSINALQRFEQWNAEREREARELAAYAAACGARALVMCPTNSRDDRRTAAQRGDDLRQALTALRPILGEQGLQGLVEPLGFEESALRSKRTAIEAIDAVAGADVLQVLHDTFHHYLAGETEMFPERTGLVHISGVEDRSLPRADIRDAHRVLVGPADIAQAMPQLATLLRAGYQGPLSYEPFATSVQQMTDIASALRSSMAFVATGLAGIETKSGLAA